MRGARTGHPASPSISRWRCAPPRGQLASRRPAEPVVLAQARAQAAEQDDDEQADDDGGDHFGDGSEHTNEQVLHGWFS